MSDRITDKEAYAILDVLSGVDHQLWCQKETMSITHIDRNVEYGNAFSQIMLELIELRRYRERHEEILEKIQSATMVQDRDPGDEG